MVIVLLLVVFALLYVLQLYFQKSFLLKILTATYLFFVASAMYFSLETYKGWPTIQKPTEGMITAIIVDDPTENTKGAIYIWVRNSNDKLMWYQSLGYNSDKEPRSFNIPYTKESAKAFREAKKSIEEGKYVFIEGGDSPSTQDTENSGVENQKNGDRIGNRGDSSNDYDVPHLKIIAPEELLKKEGPNE